MARSQRPPRTYTTDAVTRAVRIVSVVAVVAIAAWLLLLYPSLPQTIPTHFGPTGEADAWGDRSSVLALTAVMVAITMLLAWLSTRPRWLNVPVPITEQNAQALYREGERLLVWLLPCVAVLFAGIALSTLGLPGLPLLVLGGGGMLAVTGVGLARMLRAA